MLSAARRDMIGATMYLDGEERKWSEINQSYFNWRELDVCIPCPICQRMIANSGIEKVVSRKGIIWEKGN